jgi:UDP-glucose 4-epimerase
MAVAVIGGAGFIGSNLVDELMTQGFEVVVLDNLSEGKLDNLARWRGNPKLEFVRGDIRDRDLVRRVCDRKSWVFHLAAMSRIQPSIQDPHLAFEENVMGTVNVLEGCRLGGVRRLVYSASSSVTGDHGSNLVSHGQAVHEDVEVDLKTPYSLSKHFGEQACDLYHRLYGLSAVSLRYFNAYGPRHQENGSYATVIAIFRRQARLGQCLSVVGDGTQRRDFTFVGDVVRANMLAAMNQGVVGTVNIGTGKNYSINEVADMVLGEHGGVVQFIPARVGEAQATLASVQKAWDLLGWKPLVSLKDGLAITDEFERTCPPSGIIVKRFGDCFGGRDK